MRPGIRGLLLGTVAFQLGSGLALWTGLATSENPWGQSLVLVHLALGASIPIWLVPYLSLHLRIVWRSPRRAMRWMGGIAAALVVAASGTGLAMLAVAAWGGIVEQELQVWHKWLGAAGGLVLAGHLSFAARRPAGRIALGEALAGGVGAVGVVGITFAGVMLWIVELAAPRGETPAGKSISTTGALWKVRPPESVSCGTSGCHEAIYREWKESPHGRAAADPYYRALEARLLSSSRKERASLCAECHDPEVLVTGEFESGVVSRHGAEAGVSCRVCHAMRETSGRHERGNFRMAPPESGVTEDHALGRFLLRVAPWHHKAKYGRELYEKSKLCAGCHLASVKEPIEGFGLLRIENPYQRWDLDDVKPKCQTCHMPLLKTGEAHYSHRFAGSSLGLSPDGAQRKAVEEMLEGKMPLPDVNGLSRAGPLFELIVGKGRRAAGGVAFDLEIRDRGRIGHQFPAGAQDLLMVWIEAEWRTDKGAVLARWGEVEAGGPLLPGTPVFSRGGLESRQASPWSLTPSGAKGPHIFGPIRPKESRRVELLSSFSSGVAQVTEFHASLWYRKVHRAALEALGTGKDGRLLALPPRHKLAEVRARIAPDF